jgi:biopolymer transport protein TolR
MAGSIDSGDGKGQRRRSVSGDLNLVPYIDLLTCMIAFLLITAVWTQLARLPTHQRGQGESDGEPPQSKLAVAVGDQGFVLVSDGGQKPIGRRDDGAFDYEALTRELGALKRTHADKTDLQVLSEDGIQFEVLIKTMDAAMASGFPEVSLLDAAGAP